MHRLAPLCDGGLGLGLGGQYGAGWSPRHIQFSFPQPTEQFNGQGTSFNGGNISYSQPGLSGVRGLAGWMGREAHRVGTWKEGTKAGGGSVGALPGTPGLPPAHLCSDGFQGCSVNRLPSHPAVLL